MATELDKQKETLKLFILNAEDHLDAKMVKLLCEFIDASKDTKHLELAMDNFTLRLEREEIEAEKKKYLEMLLETLIKCLKAIFASFAK